MIIGISDSTLDDEGYSTLQFCSGVFCIVFRVCHVVDDVSECEVSEVKWALAAVGVTEQL